LSDFLFLSFFFFSSACQLAKKKDIEIEIRRSKKLGFILAEVYQIYIQRKKKGGGKTL